MSDARSGVDALYDQIVQLRGEVSRLKTLWEECEQDNKQLEAELLRQRGEAEKWRLASRMMDNEVEKLRRDNDLLREALRNG